MNRLSYRAASRTRQIIVLTRVTTIGARDRKSILRHLSDKLQTTVRLQDARHALMGNLDASTLHRGTMVLSAFPCARSAAISWMASCSASLPNRKRRYIPTISTLVTATDSPAAASIQE